MSVPMGALAQNDPPGSENSTVSNKIVKLDLESADLYYALKLLFSQIKADFTISPELRGTLITVRLNQPFRIALDGVLKASGLPLTWKLENNIYSIIPIVTEPTDVTPNEPGPEETTVTRDRALPRRLRTNNISAIDIVAALGGRFIPFTGSGSFAGFNPFAGRGGGGFGGGGGGFGGGGLGGGLGGGGFGQGGFGGGGLGGGGLGGGGFGGGGFGGGGLGGGFGGGGFGGGGRIGGGRGY
jgi:hypothetical protein